MRGYSTSSVFVSACAGMAFFGVAMLSLAPILGQLNGIVRSQRLAVDDVSWNPFGYNSVRSCG